MRLRMRPTSASTVLKSRCCRARVSMSACNCGARVTAKSDRRRSASGTSVSVASTLSRLPIEKNSPTRPNSLSSTATGTRTCVSPARSGPPAADPDDTENSPGTCPGSSRRNSPSLSTTVSATAPGGSASSSSTAIPGRPPRVALWPSSGSSRARLARLAGVTASTKTSFKVAPDPSSSVDNRSSRRGGPNENSLVSRPSLLKCASISSLARYGAQIASRNVATGRSASRSLPRPRRRAAIPLEKQRLAVPRMADRARQILHDILDQAAGSRIRGRDIAQRDATSQQRPPRLGLHRQRLVETCRERGSQQIGKHDGRARYTAVLAHQRAEACRLPHQPGEGTHAFGAGLNGDALRDEPDTVEAQARARKGDGVDCLTETVFVPIDDRLRGCWKDFVQQFGESPQQVGIVAEKAPRFVACIVGGVFT